MVLVGTIAICCCNHTPLRRPPLSFIFRAVGQTVITTCQWNAIVCEIPDISFGHKQKPALAGFQAQVLQLVIWEYEFCNWHLLLEDRVLPNVELSGQYTEEIGIILFSVIIVGHMPQKHFTKICKFPQVYDKQQ